MSALVLRAGSDVHYTAAPAQDRATAADGGMERFDTSQEWKRQARQPPSIARVGSGHLNASLVLIVRPMQASSHNEDQPED